LQPQRVVERNTFLLPPHLRPSTKKRSGGYKSVAQLCKIPVSLLTERTSPRIFRYCALAKNKGAARRAHYSHIMSWKSRKEKKRAALKVHFKYVSFASENSKHFLLFSYFACALCEIETIRPKDSLSSLSLSQRVLFSLWEEHFSFCIV